MNSLSGIVIFSDEDDKALGCGIDSEIHT